MRKLKAADVDVSPVSQRDGVLALLKQGMSVTPMSALRTMGCMRLAARIAELREAGYRINTRLVSEGGKTFARYSMGRN
jgi:hypothetical protein